jgi:hypothetical protein
VLRDACCWRAQQQHDSLPGTGCIRWGSQCWQKDAAAFARQNQRMIRAGSRRSAASHGSFLIRPPTPSRGPCRRHHRTCHADGVRPRSQRATWRALKYAESRGPVRGAGRRGARAHTPVGQRHAPGTPGTRQAEVRLLAASAAPAATSGARGGIARHQRTRTAPSPLQRHQLKPRD